MLGQALFCALFRHHGFLMNVQKKACAKLTLTMWLNFISLFTLLWVRPVKGSRDAEGVPITDLVSIATYFRNDV